MTAMEQIEHITIEARKLGMKYGDDDEAQMQMVFRIHGRALQNIEEALK